MSLLSYSQPPGTLPAHSSGSLKGRAVRWCRSKRPSRRPEADLAGISIAVSRPRRPSWFIVITLVVVLGGFGVPGVLFPHRRSPTAAKSSAQVASQPPPAQLCGQAGWPEAHVDGGAYVVQNDEWNSTAPECITTDGRHPQFAVTSSSIYEPVNGDPGGYPSIFSGCSAGVCTVGNKMPIRVGDLRPGMVTSSWTTTQPPGGAYDVSYDIWFNETPVTSGAPDGGELMIWLAHRGGSQISPGGEPGGTGHHRRLCVYRLAVSGHPGSGPASTGSPT